MTMRTKGLMAAMALCASAAIAAPRQSIRLEVTEPVSLAGKTLATGSYKLSWEGDTDAVKVTVARGKTVVAETQGKLVDAGFKSTDDAVVWGKAAGSPVLSKVLLKGSSKVLILAGS